MVSRPRRRRAIAQPVSDDRAPMQIRRTAIPNESPGGLAEGQLAVEMASDPPRLWVGVPTSIDPTGRREILGGSSEHQLVLGAQIAASSIGLTNLLRIDVPGFFKHGGRLFHRHAVSSLAPVGSLVSNTDYYVFLRDVGGTLVPNFVPMTQVSHAPSNTPGNEGVEVMATVGGDSDFSKVTLLLGNENTPPRGGTMSDIFIDQSLRQHSITVPMGTEPTWAKWTSNNPPPGLTSSILMGALPLMLTYGYAGDSLNFGTEDFCIEGFARLPAGGMLTVFDCGGIVLYLGGSGLSYHIAQPVGLDGVATGTVSAGTWAYWALFRIGNLFYAKVGTANHNIGSSTAAMPVLAMGLSIGAPILGTGHQIASLRVTKGASRGLNTTIPTLPFANYGPGTDDSNSLIGMVRTADQFGVAFFLDAQHRRFVRSWFNRRRVRMIGPNIYASSVSLGTTGGAVLELQGINPAPFYSRLAWMHWKDEVVSVRFFCPLAGDVNQNTWHFPGIGIDSAVNQSSETLNYTIWAGHRMFQAATVIRDDLSEGLHDARPLYSSAGGSVTYWFGDRLQVPRLEGFVS